MYRKLLRFLMLDDDKTRLKRKDRSQIYGINRPMSRDGQH